MVRAKLFWKDGPQMQSIKSHCLMKVDRRENQTGRICLEDHSSEATPAERGRWHRNWKISLNKEGLGGKIRQRPDFLEAKHAYRRLFLEHVVSTGQGNKQIHPAQQRRQNSQQQFDEHEEYARTVHHRTGWKYHPSTNSSSSSQWHQHDDWRSNQSWDYWRSSTWTGQSYFLGRNHKHRKTCCKK